MPFLVGAELPHSPAGERFRALLVRPGILQMPGAHTGMASLLAKRAGFEAVYVGGSAMTGTMGLPDLGIITVEEVCFYTRQVARASGLPLLVDGDTGHGEALNVMHMVRSFEDAGAAAVHIEDQLLPKKCGHLNDKKLADAREAAAKIAAAVKARRHLYIIARTDAADSEGMDGAVARAKLYLEAGADAVFPEALTTAEMFRESGVNLMQVNAQGRIIQIAFEATPVSTDKFRIPYILEGELRAFNQEMLERTQIRSQALFFCLENARNTWRYVEWLHGRTGAFDRDQLVSLLERLV